MRPLDFLGSIKLKLGVVIVAAVLVTIGVVLLGEQLDVSPFVTGIAAVAIGLAMIRFLAHGMTYPLREMADAAKAMARGEYDRRVTATSRDEVGELARAFNSMVTELAEVDRMRRDLVANASHELRTPIGALRARFENLVDGIEQPDPETLADALRQVERLGKLVEQLLDLSKLESGAVPLERRGVDARALLEDVTSEWRGPAAARGVALVAVIEPSGLTLQADERRIRQVLVNLVANAVRHARRSVRVSVRSTGSAGTRLEVFDDGPGIAPAEAERVFERFYRSDRARTTDDGGAGLGLAIARWVVDLHGGKIFVDPDSEDGCRVVVELPA
ncbi:MAG: sensor histidine kinase [Gaiella sp.]